MSRTDVLEEFGLPAYHGPIGYIGMADEIVRLRERLAGVEAERDSLQAQVAQWWGKDTAERIATVEADLETCKRDSTILRLSAQSFAKDATRGQRILAALREPSEAVMAAARADLWISGSVVQDALRAAVAAAEKEASDDPR